VEWFASAERQRYDRTADDDEQLYTDLYGVKRFYESGHNDGHGNPYTPASNHLAVTRALQRYFGKRIDSKLDNDEYDQLYRLRRLERFTGTEWQRLNRRSDENQQLYVELYGDRRYQSGHGHCHGNCPISRSHRLTDSFSGECHDGW